MEIKLNLEALAQIVLQASVAQIWGTVALVLACAVLAWVIRGQK